MIPMNSEDVEAEKVRRFIEYTGGGIRQGIVNASSEPDEDIRQLILKWALNEARVTFDVEFNILAYWKKNLKTKWNRPYEISQVVYGAAFTSVKVERDFSGFALVYSHLRTRFLNDFLNSIMVVKNNLDIIDKTKLKKFSFYSLTLSLPTTSILVVSWRYLFAYYEYTRS